MAKTRKMTKKNLENVIKKHKIRNCLVKLARLSIRGWYYFILFSPSIFYKYLKFTQIIEFPLKVMLSTRKHCLKCMAFAISK